MIEIVWEFTVHPVHRSEFEKHYGPAGTWAELFCHDTAFHGTSLLRDREIPNRYLTIDRWDDLPSYEAFRIQYAREYQQIDAQMERLTEKENRLGVFESL